MSTITLIATTHKENGLCTSKELLKILHTINPDVIFEELSEQSFTDRYEGRQPDSLETTTIKTYSNYKSFKHHPVDVDGDKLIDKTLKNSISNMFDIFERNPHYQNMRLKLQNLTWELGFFYLNSFELKHYLHRNIFWSKG